MAPEVYRDQRYTSLAEAIQLIYDTTEKPLSLIKDKQLPLLAMEIEPGPPFLLNSIDAFRAMRKKIKDECGNDLTAYNHLVLNVDIAHAFLINIKPEHLKGMGDNNLVDLVGHMHISDHAGGFSGITDNVPWGAHSSDLVPGVFHLYEDYRDWLKFAISQCNQKNNCFSKTIAVELEACNDKEMIFQAVRIVNRWLIRAKNELINANNI